MIDENDDGNLSKLFLIALYNYVGDDNSGRDVLFKKKENISFLSESSGRTLVGFDEEEKTSWKIYNYTNVNQPDNFYVVNCIPFYVDDEGTFHAFSFSQVIRMRNHMHPMNRNQAIQEMKDHR